MRVYILGAGSSLYAGFPLGKHLWDFLLDHCAMDTDAMEAICAYLSTLDADERTKATNDLEKLLTDFEEGIIPPMPAMEKSASTDMDWDLREKNAVRSSLRHTLQNEPKFDFDSFWMAQRCRRTSPVTMWGFRPKKSSVEVLIGSFVNAFLLHHACIRFGRRHFRGTGDPWPTIGQEKFSRCCPCRQRIRIGSIHRTFEAIARRFHPGDIIITFNYDATIETSLWFGGKWNFASGYGFLVDVSTSKYLTGSATLQAPSPIKVLKPHGSINWIRSILDEKDEKVGINYLGLLFDLPGFSTYTPSLDPETGIETKYIKDTLLAPTYMKDYSAQPTMRIIWDQVDAALREAADVTIVGYSLPCGDKAARERFAAALRLNNKCTNVTVVSRGDPEHSAWPSFLDSVNKRMDWQKLRFEDWISSAQGSHLTGAE
jgi:hypothetical protein